MKGIVGYAFWLLLAFVVFDRFFGAVKVTGALSGAAVANEYALTGRLPDGTSSQYPYNPV